MNIQSDMATLFEMQILSFEVFPSRTFEFHMQVISLQGRRQGHLRWWSDQRTRAACGVLVGFSIDYCWTLWADRSYYKSSNSSISEQTCEVGLERILLFVRWECCLCSTQMPSCIDAVSVRLAIHERQWHVTECLNAIESRSEDTQARRTREKKQIYIRAAI